MSSSHKIDVMRAAGICAEEADSHKILANKASEPRRRDEHLAKSAMADHLASCFRALPLERDTSPAEIDRVAREIDPECFARHAAMVKRLVDEGADEGHATHMADASYGAAIHEARERAACVCEPASGVDAMQELEAGVNAAIRWHLRQASQAEDLERQATEPDRKRRYRKRADRHRLYARHMRSDFDAKRTEIGRGIRLDQPGLPLSKTMSTGPDAKHLDDHVPIEVQRAFLKKSEVFDDEGFE